MKFTFDEFLALQERQAGPHAAIHLLDENSSEVFEERAAILQFCEGLSRMEAEQRALDALRKQPEPP